MTRGQVAVSLNHPECSPATEFLKCTRVDAGHDKTGRPRVPEPMPREGIVRPSPIRQPRCLLPSVESCRCSSRWLAGQYIARRWARRFIGGGRCWLPPSPLYAWRAASPSWPSSTPWLDV